MVLSDEGSKAVSRVLNGVLGALMVECRRASALLNMCGSPEVRTAIRLLFVGEQGARAMKAACAAITRMLQKHPHSFSSGPLSSSRSTQCGLVFPVGRVHRYLIEQCVSCRVDVGAAVAVAAVLDFLCLELLRHAVDLSMASTTCIGIDSSAGAANRSSPRADGSRRQTHVSSGGANAESESGGGVHGNSESIHDDNVGLNMIENSTYFVTASIAAVHITHPAPSPSITISLPSSHNRATSPSSPVPCTSLSSSPSGRLASPGRHANIQAPTIVIDDSHIDRACAEDEALFPVFRATPNLIEGFSRLSATPLTASVVIAGM